MTLQTAHAAIGQGHICDFQTVQSNTQQTLTGLPVPLPGFVVELTQDKEVDNVWHVVVSG